MPEKPDCERAGQIAPFIVPYTRGRGLDIGCGPFPAFPHFIGIDPAPRQQPRPPQGQWIEAQPDDLSFLADASMDFVFSSHLLHKLEQPGKALLEWWRVIRPDGHLVLYQPDVCQHANSEHRLDRSSIASIMEDVAHTGDFGWTLVEDDERAAECTFFQVFRKHHAPKKDQAVRCFERPWRKPEKAALVIRYGAIGDHIMVSSVLPYLKAQGWHITYQCNPRGEEVLRHDPHIDAFWVQDTDQVPNAVLGPYWARMAERFDRVFNLTQAVEESLLAVPGRLNHGWLPETRRRIMGSVNYIDRHHDLCAVPRGPRTKFYATDREIMWAKKQRKRLPGDGPVILWALSGSSVHKFWPYMDNAIAWLMLNSKARVVLTGAGLDEILTVGWEDEPRVVNTVGEWDARQSLAFGVHGADIVIGPETGLLNAVSMEPDVAKIIYLSHSSFENAAKGWVNATVLMAPDTLPCSPCHRMHYGFEFCHQDERTGAAACQALIPLEKMVEAMTHHLQIMEKAA